MIAVIQCAGTKQPGAARLVRKDGKPVMFVADPAGAPPDNALVYARPDDISDRGVSWRDVLLAYNKAPGDNSLSLLPAWQLYRNDVYARLVRKLGVGNVYILSAGWGLIAASFLTPDYDITFAQMKPEISAGESGRLQIDPRFSLGCRELRADGGRHRRPAAVGCGVLAPASVRIIWQPGRDRFRTRQFVEATSRAEPTPARDFACRLPRHISRRVSSSGSALEPHWPAPDVR